MQGETLKFVYFKVVIEVTILSIYKTLLKSKIQLFMSKKEVL